MRFENNNKEVVERITKRSLKTNKVRNTFTIIAIMLTTFMISSVFSLGISFVKNYKTMILRMQGNSANIALENPTASQIKEIKSLDIFKDIGYKIDVGKVELSTLTKNKNKIAIQYSSKENFEKQVTPCVSDIKGKYPTEINQIMASKKALDFLEKSDAKIGDKIKVPCKINKETVNKEFILSGYYTNYGIVQDTGYLLVSAKFVEANNLTLKDNGTLFMTLKSKFKGIAKEVLDKKIVINSEQKFIYNFDESENSSETVWITVALIGAIALFIVLSGYLLIYNVLYIAVTKDINFYGLLKTIGASPKQIKKIVKGQALRLSIIGIPLGLALGAIVSFLIVPLTMRMFFSGASASAMPSDVSFNPLIFIAASIFSLITVILSSNKPARIAGNISPIKALRYIGSSNKKQKKNRNSTNGGNLYKMAWYNVFREKKRAIVVFLSLFMGIITFLSVNTFLSSLSVENYLNAYVKNDFEINNVEIKNDKIDDTVIKTIKDMEGVKSLEVLKTSVLELEMNENVLLPALNEIYKRFNHSEDELKKYLKEVKKDPQLLTATVVGIDESLIERYNSGAKEKIDIESFKRGELALVSSWYYGEDYKNIKGNLTIKNPKANISKSLNTKTVNYKLGLLPFGLPAPLGIPTIYISNLSLEELDKNAVNNFLYINIDKKYDGKIKTELKKISNNRGLLLESKSDQIEDFNNSQRVMNIIGGGISEVLILIGILNFINVMITGVNIRLKELAVMESIGMTKNQIKKMLTFEGLYYAGLTTLFILTIGMAITYGIGELTKQIADYAVFVFPARPLVILIILIFVVCLITPRIVFKISSKKSVTERIREI